MISKIVVLCALETAAISGIFLQLPGFLCSVHLKVRQFPGFLCSVYLMQFSGFLCSVCLGALQFQRIQNLLFDLQAGMAVFWGRCCWGFGHGPFKKGSALGGHLEAGQNTSTD